STSLLVLHEPTTFEIITLSLHDALPIFGNVALVDRHLNHVSVITIVHWLMKGRKDSYLGIFPKPGVSEADISGAVKFGRSLLPQDRKSTRLNSSHVKISYAVFCLKKKTT